MNNLLNFIVVGAGGALGAMMRYGLTLLLTGRPLAATLAANVLGSFLIGLFMGSTQGRALLFLSVGICGGFTTFSTFSAQTVSLLQAGDYLMAGVYALGSVILCLIGCYAGLRITP